MTEPPPRETVVDNYNWWIEFKGLIEVKGEYETIPTGYPMLRHLERAIADTIKKECDKYRLYKYHAGLSDYDPDGMEFESDT
jgi:hypothetical protein